MIAIVRAERRTRVMVPRLNLAGDDHHYWSVVEPNTSVWALVTERRTEPLGRTAMTDLDTLKAMFDRAGLTYHEAETHHHVRPRMDGEGAIEPPVGTTLTLQANDTNARQTGYFNFETEFFFDEAGALWGAAIWE
jgi:hypothetical protein